MSEVLTKQKEDIIAQIQKLLAKGDKTKNNSDAEAEAAILLAQKLLTKYDIALEEVQDTVEQEYAIEQAISKWDYSYKKPLACVLADNFRCKTYMQGKRIIFFGHPNDARICKEVFEFAYAYITKEGYRLYNKRYTMGLETKNIVNSYATGFIIGLKKALDQQCRALMIITPPDVESKFEEMSSDWKTHKSKRPAATDSEAFYKGTKDGEKFMDKRQIE